MEDHRRLRDMTGQEQTMDTPTAEQLDMAARWHPSETAVRHARALLAAEPRADIAGIPMVQPGKKHSWWQVGQEVETVPGAVFLGVNRFDVDADEVPSWSWARHVASVVASLVLGDRPGTVAYAVVYRDGIPAVFEEYPVDVR